MRPLLVLALAVTSCGDSPEGPTDAALEIDAAIDAAPPAATGTIALPACTGVGGVAETCELVVNASACTGARCSKLVVVFSGGESGCTMASYTAVLADYAAHGWAAVCIDAFDTPMGSGQVPYVDEAPRYDLAVREATTGAWARAYWTGGDLLFEGISHGASAPLIAMARTTLDDAAHWHGSGRTAACFYDGTYDQYASAEHLRTGTVSGGPCTFPVPYSRWLERYCGAGATTATCDLQTVPKAVADTITGAPVANLAIHDFRLVECGSATPVCTSDILPAPPIAALCSAIDAASDHTCTYATLPNDSHLTCHRDHGAECRPWFEALP